ncbi:hypothetical protein VTK56DRAFT_8207 [Thermocarpiscus australiensis]
MTNKLTPTDPRVQRRVFTNPASGQTYGFLLAEPPSPATATATVLLVHGFPDLSLGWRYQVPFLLARNLRVIVPDMLGYGRSDAPPPRDLAAYSLKRAVDDLVALVRHVLLLPGGGSAAAPDDQPEAEAEAEGEAMRRKIVVGGHDWGGAVAWRFALWYPGMLRGVFSVCTPYYAPSGVFVSRREMVARLPNFGYQLQFASGEVEAAVVGPDKIRGFLSILYGGKGKDGERLFDPASGVRLDKLEEVGKSPLLNEEEMEFYVGEFARNGMRGPLNWYRTERFNYEEELKLVEEGRSRVTMPTLMITASRDVALPPAMAAAMDRYCDDLVKREVDAGHWALWEKPAEVNQHIGEFLDVILKAERPLKASI